MGERSTIARRGCTLPASQTAEAILQRAQFGKGAREPTVRSVVPVTSRWGLLVVIDSYGSCVDNAYIAIRSKRQSLTETKGRITPRSKPGTPGRVLALEQYLPKGC